MQFIIATLLERAGWNTSLEVRLKVAPDAEPVPDVIAVQGKFKGPYPTSAPELCVEILSPGDTLPKTLEKAKRYISWGSQCVWMIDPEKRTAWTLSRDRTPDPSWISPGGVLRIADTAIDLDPFFQKSIGNWRLRTQTALVNRGATEWSAQTLKASASSRIDPANHSPSEQHRSTEHSIPAMSVQP